MTYTQLREERKRIRHRMGGASGDALGVLKDELADVESQMEKLPRTIGDIYAAIAPQLHVPQSQDVSLTEGPCKSPSDVATDGSKCGGRAPNSKKQGEASKRGRSYLAKQKERANQANSFDELASIQDEQFIVAEEIESYLKSSSKKEKPSFNDDDLNWIVENAGQDFEMPVDTDWEEAEGAMVGRMLTNAFQGADIDAMKSRFNESGHPMKEIESLLSDVESSKFSAKKAPELEQLFKAAKEIEKQSEYGLDPSEPISQSLKENLSGYYDEQVKIKRNQTQGKVEALVEDYRSELSDLIAGSDKSEKAVQKIQSQFEKRLSKVIDHNDEHGLLGWDDVADDPDPKRYKAPKLNTESENWLAQFGDVSRLPNEDTISDLITEILNNG